MKKTAFGMSAAIFLLIAATTGVSAHCEIPCGIYDDPARFKLIREHITTVEKAMKQIEAIQGKHNDPNQLVRWIANKEKHATELQHITAQYFMTQRIKPDAAQYADKLKQLHLMLVYGMKCKQSIDLDNVAKLRAAVDAFEKLYTK